MRCVRCMAEVPRARAEFLMREGREVVCISCQEEMERSGEYRAYKGVVVTDRKGRHYDFAITTTDVTCDPFEAYRKKSFREAE